MKILFAADLHLDPLIWKRLPKVYGDAYDSWRQIVEAAVERKVGAVVLGGDVFDRHPPPEALNWFLRGIWTLRAAKIPVLAIQGQHGRDRILSWSSVDPDGYVVDLNGAILEFSPFIITGVDNMPPAQLRDHLGSLDRKVNVLVLHQMVKNMVPTFGGREIWDCDPDWVPDHVKLVLLGDYHSAVERTFKGIKFKYNGSTVLRKIDEPDEKFFHIVDQDFSIEKVQLTTRPVWRGLFLTEKISEEELAKLTEHLKGLPDDTVVYIKHNPRIADIESWRLINDKLHYIFKPVVIRTEQQESTAVETKPTNITLRGCLDQVLDREKDPALYDFLVDLLDTEGPAETIMAHKQRCLEEADADVSKAASPKLLPAPEPGP